MWNILGNLCTLLFIFCLVIIQIISIYHITLHAILFFKSAWIITLIISHLYVNLFWFLNMSVPLRTILMLPNEIITRTETWNDRIWNMLPSSWDGKLEGISYDPGCAGWVRAGVPDKEGFHPSGTGWGFPLKCSLIRRHQFNKPQT